MVDVAMADRGLELGRNFGGGSIGFDTIVFFVLSLYLVVSPTMVGTTRIAFPLSRTSGGRRTGLPDPNEINEVETGNKIDACDSLGLKAPTKSTRTT